MNKDERVVFEALMVISIYASIALIIIYCVESLV